MGPIGVFGGTFDPIHIGHLRIAVKAFETLRLAQLRFIPSFLTPGRPAPTASASARLAMIEAAVAGQPGFIADGREIARGGASYTIDTLIELRAEWPSTPLCLLLGMDAFLSLPRWHRWREIFDYAHVVVAHRPGWTVKADSLLGEVFIDRSTGSTRELHESTAGRIHITKDWTQLQISSTAIRQMVLSRRDIRFLVPDAVHRMINDDPCYAARGEISCVNPI